MGEHAMNVERLRYGVPACIEGRDSVDRLLLDWERERPDLDFTPVGVITRLARVRGYLDAAVGEVFARYGLTAADFVVIIALRRVGRTYMMPQARLMDALGLTSGTVSVRLDRLEKSGVVDRKTDPSNARGSLVTLTKNGLDLFDEIAPVHLANEDRLLSALSVDERHVLADLLRRLLADFEGSSSQVAAEIGLSLEPAHIARARRQAVGLSDAPGLLVRDVAPHSAAANAGIERGDLITSFDGTTVTSSVGLANQLEDLADPGRTATVELHRGDDKLRVRLKAPKPGGQPGQRTTRQNERLPPLVR